MTRRRVITTEPHQRIPNTRSNVECIPEYIGEIVTAITDNSGSRMDTDACAFLQISLM